MPCAIFPALHVRRAVSVDGAKRSGIRTRFFRDCVACHSTSAKGTRARGAFEGFVPPGVAVFFVLKIRASYSCI